jgi:hypothetical protein
MGEGLQRAFAAARATRHDPPSPAATIEMQLFLGALVRNGGSASRKHLPIASRKQDAIRKKAKALGWAEYLTGEWRITDTGRNAYNSDIKG